MKKSQTKRGYKLYTIYIKYKLIYPGRNQIICCSGMRYGLQKA